MEQQGFDQFVGDLKEVMREGIEDIVGPNRVDDVLTYFEVEKQIILCRKTVDDINKPSAEALADILKDPLKFELVYRNYRSPEALNLFEGSVKKLKAYLKKLKSDGIIVCFDVIFDFSFGIARDYVPMIIGVEREGPVVKLLEDAKKTPELLGPVREWMKVRPIHTADDAEQEINYLFINEYDYPGQRTRWKQAMYSHSKQDINLYNYPLESTLNESPIYLSDLPELINKVRLYEPNAKDRRLLIGRATHPLLPNPPEVALPLSGLARQGVTLGEPGMGKTNTDLVIASEADKALKLVVVLDASGGVNSKADTLPKATADRLKTVEVRSADTVDDIRQVLGSEGFYFMTTTKDELPQVFSTLMTLIETSSDQTASNEPRKVTKMLMVEEAGDAFGNNPDAVRESVTRLAQVLTKAYRKGWCVWLSTQYPSSLGYDVDSAARVLSLLQNRVVSAIKPKGQIDILVNVFRNEGHSETELGVLQELPMLPRGVAVCRAVSIDASGSKETNLPLLKVNVRLLEKREGA
jgi:hypothetical protein